MSADASSTCPVRAPWLLLGCAVALGTSRLMALGLKLPHHDEMVHQWFSETLAFQGTYQASAAYHGPLLYHLQAGAMRLLGADLWVARLIPALAGIAAALGLVGLAVREAGRGAAVAVAILVTLSPVWIYYSRFDGHDSLILLMTVAVAWGRWLWSQGHVRAATWLIALALVLAWCTKLNALFIAGAIVLWPLVRWLMLRADGAAPRWPSRPRLSTVAFVGITMLAVTGGLFATTFLAHLANAAAGDALQATLRAATVDPIEYWARLDREQRLGGPFHYYAALLTLYEPLLVAGAAIALAAAWRHAPRPAWRLGATIGTGLALAGALWPFARTVQSLLHLHPAHVVVLPTIGVSLWLLCRQSARDGNEPGVWWAWMAATQTALYSYAGEKVPWLAVHVVLPWVMVAGPTLARAWHEARAWARGVLIACALLTAWGALCVTTWTRTDPAEPMVQLEYAPPTHVTMARLADACATTAREPHIQCLETTKGARWVAEWYLRGRTAAGVGGRGFEADVATPFVFVPARRATADEGRVRFEATHVPHELRFAVWGTWVDWLQSPTPADLLHFWWRRRSLGRRMGVPYELWVRRDLAHAWPDDVEQTTEGSRRDDKT